MMQDLELHFVYRAKQEQKEIVLSCADDISLFCDRDWLSEMSEIVFFKNSFSRSSLSAWAFNTAAKELME